MNFILSKAPILRDVIDFSIVYPLSIRMEHENSSLTAWIGVLQGKLIFLEHLKVNYLNVEFSWSATFREGSRTAASSKMEHFVIIVNGWRPVSDITKSSILDVAAFLDPPLTFFTVNAEKNLAVHLWSMYWYLRTYSSKTNCLRVTKLVLSLQALDFRFQTFRNIKIKEKETVASKIMEIPSNILHCNMVITKNTNHAKSSVKIISDACYQERKGFKIKTKKQENTSK